MLENTSQVDPGAEVSPGLTLLSRSPLFPAPRTLVTRGVGRFGSRARMGREPRSFTRAPAAAKRADKSSPVPVPTGPARAATTPSGGVIICRHYNGGGEEGPPLGQAGRHAEVVKGSERSYKNHGGNTKLREPERRMRGGRAPP